MYPVFSLNSDGVCHSKAFCLVSDNTVFGIRSLTWDEWSHPQLLLLCGLSDPRIAELCFVYLSPSLWACMGVNLLDMPRTPF